MLDDKNLIEMKHRDAFSGKGYQTGPTFLDQYEFEGDITLSRGSLRRTCANPVTSAQQTFLDLDTNDMLSTIQNITGNGNGNSNPCVSLGNYQGTICKFPNTNAYIIHSSSGFHMTPVAKQGSYSYDGNQNSFSFCNNVMSYSIGGDSFQAVPACSGAPPFVDNEAHLGKFYAGNWFFSSGFEVEDYRWDMINGGSGFRGC